MAPAHVKTSYANDKIKNVKGVASKSEDNEVVCGVEPVPRHGRAPPPAAAVDIKPAEAIPPLLPSRLVLVRIVPERRVPPAAEDEDGPAMTSSPPPAAGELAVVGGSGEGVAVAEARENNEVEKKNPPPDRAAGLLADSVVEGVVVTGAAVAVVVSAWLRVSPFFDCPLAGEALDRTARSEA